MKANSLHNNFEFLASKNQMKLHGTNKIGQPIERSSLDRVRDWLRQNHPEPGSRLLPERTLAETLDMSRPELRKALAVLEIEGLIARHVGQ
jgi:DNA-binding GntR family transcriptional regulator